MGYDIEIRAERWQKSKMEEIIVNDYHEAEWSWVAVQKDKRRRTMMDN